MIVRNPWTTEPFPSGGPWNSLGAVPGASDRALLTELHALALSIYQATQDVLAAQARGDVSYVQARIQDVRRLRDIFATTSAQFTAKDPYALGAIDRFILGTGTWIEQSLRALPGAIAALPIALVDGLGRVAGSAGVSVLGGILPWVGLGLVVIWLVGKAEKTGTGRRLLHA